jgi:hypothetical protein
MLGIFFSASCTAYLDNAMLVVGTQPCDYVPLHPADDLARCLRYYEIAAGGEGMVSAVATANAQTIFATFAYKAVKPLTSTVTLSGFSNVNAGNAATNVIGLWGMRVGVVSTAAGNFYSAFSFTIEANP